MHSLKSRPTVSRLGVIAAALGLVLAFSGCGADFSATPGAKSLREVLAGPSPADAADMALDPYDPQRRFRGTLLLANAKFAGEPLYMQLFADGLRDPDPGVRLASARAIANHGVPSQAMSLVPLLKDDNQDVRLEAAKGLQRLHEPKVVDALLERLDPKKEPQPEVRAEIAEALGQYAEGRVVQALIAALDDNRLSVNRRAEASLRTLTGNDLGLDRGAWVRWSQTAGESRTLFAARAAYVHPAYYRAYSWWEYLPFVQGPKNETAGLPKGFPERFGG